MQETSGNRRKVVVVGAGAVGATFAYALAQSGLADEIVLIDRNEDLVRGQVLDLAHGQPFFPTVSIRKGDAFDYASASLIVITAGAAQRPGETRLQLLQKNAAVIKGVMTDIIEHDSPAVILVVTNPVDVMTYVALETSGWDRSRIIGSGTVLDSARLEHLLSAHCGVDVHNVHGFVLGEHGDTEFVAWSLTHIAGMQMDVYCPICKGCADNLAEREAITQQVRDSAYHIIGYKGATWFAVGLALVRIAGAILRNQRSVLTVSALLHGEFGLSDVCIGVPCIVSARGIERVVESVLSESELAALHSSARTLKKAVEQLHAGA